MKLDITKIIEPLELGEYAEGMKGQTVRVWVNPNRAVIRERELLIETYNRKLREMNEEAEKAKGANQKAALKIAEKFRAKMDDFSEYAANEFINGTNEWFAGIWSQHQDPSTHWTVDELKQLNEADPALYQWLKNKTIEMIEAHRAREKKG